MSERKLVVIDTETTGVNPAVDRIVELAIINSDGVAIFNSRFSPDIPIPPEATAIHGIGDDDVKDCHPFSTFATNLHEALQNTDIAGFEVRGFDIAILAAEFARCGIDWDHAGHVVDVAVIYKKLRPRRLVDAVLEYLERPHDGAHGALADAKATLEVLKAMSDKEPELRGKTIFGLAEFSQYGDMPAIDIAGKLVRDRDGDARYNFGNSRGVKIRDDPGLAWWLLEKDFPANTKRCTREELKRCGLSTSDPRWRDDWWDEDQEEQEDDEFDDDEAI